MRAQSSPRMGRDARSRRAKRAAATAVLAAAGFGFGVAALGLGAAALAAGEWRQRAGRRIDVRGSFTDGTLRRRREPLSDREFRNAIDREGRVIPGKFACILRRAASDGVAPESRPEVWPLLLGVRQPWSTAVEQEQRRRDRKAGYDALLERRDDLEGYLGAGGAMAMRAGREGGVGSSGGSGARGGKYSFGAVGWGASREDATVGRKNRGRFEETRERDLAAYAESVPVIRADVPRTAFHEGGAFESEWRLERSARRDDAPSRGGVSNGSASEPSEEGLTYRAAQSVRLRDLLTAYALHDSAVGYCQGMNEIAARFLENVVDASEAFWCFAAFLEAYRPHFIIDPPTRERSESASTRRVPDTHSRYPLRSPSRPPRESVRDVLRDLGSIFRRCDPPVWKHLVTLGATECVFAFRAVVVLLARELPPSETTFLWEALMASGDHLRADDDERRVRDDVSGDSLRNVSANRFVERGAGDGGALLHCVAAVFVRGRRLVFECREFDDLLHAAHHAVAATCGDAAAILETARGLAARPWREGEDEAKATTGEKERFG